MLKTVNYNPVIIPRRLHTFFFRLQ